MEENKNPNLSQESISNRISQLKKGQSNNNNSFNRSSNGFPNALPQTDPSNNELDENGNELDNNEEVVDETLNEQTSFFENSASSLIPSQENSIQKGTYIDISDDIYIVYEVGEDFYKLQSNKVLSKEMAFSKKTNDYKESDLKEYLEKTYLEKLSYKDFLKEITWENEVVSK